MLILLSILQFVLFQLIFQLKRFKFQFLSEPCILGLYLIFHLLQVGILVIFFLFVGLNEQLLFRDDLLQLNDLIFNYSVCFPIQDVLYFVSLLFDLVLQDAILRLQFLYLGDLVVPFEFGLVEASVQVLQIILVLSNLLLIL